MSGRLQVCSTPIGNLGDVTLRVLDALRAADVVLAEDTRVTHKLFARFDITTQLERFDENTAARRTPELVERLRAGATIALVSDAGTPGVSDPGAHLIEACIASGVPIETLPGASAVLAALVASGMPMKRFFFGGFLPRKAGERRSEIAAVSALDATLVYFESPHRAAASLADLAVAMPDRPGALARELTKLHEEVVRAPLPELAEQIAQRDQLKGEVVLLVGPPVARLKTQIDPAAIRARVDELVAGGSSRTQAVKLVASEMGLSRNTVYDVAHAK